MNKLHTILCALLIAPFNAAFAANQIDDSAIPTVWTFSNKTKVPVKYVVAWKNMFPNSDFSPKAKELKDQAVTIKPDDKKMIGADFASLMGFLFSPFTIEASSPKGNASWQAPKRGFYDVEFNLKNGKLSIKATPWSESKQKAYRNVWPQQHDALIKEYNKGIAPKIKQMKSASQSQTFIFGK